jgi:tetratricopeptide (TPR) repeat protein
MNPDAMERRWPAGLAGALIVLAGILAYANSFAVPLVLDDLPSIRDNPTIRQLWPPGGALSPPRGTGLTVEGRPILNLSLACNFAVGGLGVWSYHAVNLAIHLLAGLTLFGIVRRTRVCPESGWWGGRAGGFALAAALLWTVHPLQTEAVTYVIQRAESLMGLCYLLTLYCFIRSLAGPRQTAWSVAAVAACAVGMATKEVMASAPLMVLAYDRTFVAGSWRVAWRSRGRTYLGLGATWLLLAVLAVRTGSRGGTSGLGSGVEPLRYWATQPAAIAHYLRLSFWPANQVFDYGTEGLGSGAANVPADLAGFLPGGLLLLALAAASGWALMRGGRQGARWGFLGLVFLAVLAPTSLIPGNRQTLAEHRMYLALAPVLIAALATGAWLLQAAVSWLQSALRRVGRARVGEGRALGFQGAAALELAAAERAVPARAVPLSARFERAGLSVAGLAVAGLAAAGIAATRARNSEYRSPVALFAADVSRRPANPYARANLGMALAEVGRVEEAVGSFREALRLRPVYPVAEDDLGNALLRLGRREEAEACYRRALREDPRFAAAHNNLGRALLEAGDLPGADGEIGAALQLDPDLTEARSNRAGLLARSGRFEEALAEYRAIVAGQPDDAGVRNDFGIALAQSGDRADALAQYREAVRIDPTFPEARANLAAALAATGRSADAIAEYRRALALRPGFTSARNNLGNVLLRSGQAEAAVAEYEAALRYDPAHAASHYNLGNALLGLGRTDRAIVEFREALRLQPDLGLARQRLEQLGAGP